MIKIKYITTIYNIYGPVESIHFDGSQKVYTKSISNTIQCREYITFTVSCGYSLNIYQNEYF